MKTTCAAVQDDLAVYAAGGLEPGRRREIEQHLAECAGCRAELALWTAVGRRVVAEDRSLPAPGPQVLTGALAAIAAAQKQPAAAQKQPATAQKWPGAAQRRRQASPLASAWQVLLAQLPLVRREIWLASAFVMGMGCVLSLWFDSGRTDLVVIVAPLIAAAGVALIYGPDNDPALELALATPTSPRQVLLARLFLVFGYDLVLALAASLLLLVLAGAGGLGAALVSVVLSWLAPMTLLSALALVLSLWIGAGNAASMAFFVWLLRWQVHSMAAGRGVQGLQELTGVAMAIEGAATNLGLQFGLAALLLALAIWLAGRPSTNIRSAAL